MNTLIKQIGNVKIYKPNDEKETTKLKMKYMYDKYNDLFKEEKYYEKESELKKDKKNIFI